MNRLKHELGYEGVYEATDDFWYQGHLVGVPTHIPFGGSTLEELNADFREVVEDYVDRLER